MGGVFCSYFIGNQISELRRKIEESKFGEPSQSLDESTRKKLSNLIDSEIDSNGNTPLLYSIELRQLKSFKFLLLEMNANPNKPNYQTGYTPLHILASTKPYVTKSSNDLAEKENLKNKTSANSASSAKTLKTFSKSLAVRTSILLSNESDIDLQSNDINLTRQNINFIDPDDLTEMLSLLIDFKKADVNVPTVPNEPNEFDIKLASPLQLAILNENSIAVEKLTKSKNCNLNYKDEFSKITALHMCCYMSNPYFVSLLLENQNIELNHRSREGSTCLHWLACSSKDDIGVFSQIMNCLTKKFKIINQNLSTEEYFDNLDLYLKKFIDETNNSNQTALMLAANSNKQNLVKSLLDYQADVNAKDINGLNALNYSNQNSCFELIRSYNRIKKITFKKTSSYFYKNQVEENDI